LERNFRGKNRLRELTEFVLFVSRTVIQTA
jgi:hypothetical protein